MLEVFRFMFRLTMGVLPEEGRGAGAGDGLNCCACGAAAALSPGEGKGVEGVSEVLLAPSMPRISARGWASSGAKGLAGSGLNWYRVGAR